MRSTCCGAEPRRLVRNSGGDMNFSSAKKKPPSSRNRLRCSAAESTRRPASKPTARVSDHFVSNTVRPDDVIVKVTSRLSTVWPRPVRLKISGTLSPVRSRSTIPSRTVVSLRTGVEASNCREQCRYHLRRPFPRQSRPLPNGSLLSCGLRRPQSRWIPSPSSGRRGPSASSAC